MVDVWLMVWASYCRDGVKFSPVTYLFSHKDCSFVDSPGVAQRETALPHCFEALLAI